MIRQASFLFFVLLQTLTFSLTAAETDLVFLRGEIVLRGRIEKVDDERVFLIDDSGRRQIIERRNILRLAYADGVDWPSVNRFLQEEKWRAAEVMVGNHLGNGLSQQPSLYRVQAYCRSMQDDPEGALRSLINGVASNPGQELDLLRSWLPTPDPRRRRRLRDALNQAPSNVVRNFLALLLTEQSAFANDWPEVDRLAKLYKIDSIESLKPAWSLIEAKRRWHAGDHAGSKALLDQIDERLLPIRHGLLHATLAAEAGATDDATLGFLRIGLKRQLYPHVRRFALQEAVVVLQTGGHAAEAERVTAYLTLHFGALHPRRNPHADKD